MLMSNIINNLKISRKFVRLSSSTRIDAVQNASDDPLEVLSDDALSYQNIFFTLRHQAQRTLLLRVNTDPEIDQEYLVDHLNKFCSEHGDILHLAPVRDSPNHFLVEFSKEDGIHNLSSSSTDGALRLRMTELSPTGLNLSLRNKKTNNLSKDNLCDQIKNVSNVSDQIHLYFQRRRATSDQIRQRLFFSSLFEDFFNWHLKTNITAMPFGTTWMGFSSQSSDIDISLTQATFSGFGNNISSLNGIPHSAALKYVSLHRAGANALFKEAAKIVNLNFPGVVNLSSHDALHPILSFHFSPLALNVEITHDNRSGIQMAFVINMYTRMDERVAPFLFLLRQWTSQCGITKHGGLQYEGLTPFMLVTLGLFYLMRISPNVIPPMQELLNLAQSYDDFVLGGFRTKLVNDVRSLKGSNSESIEDLFYGFLEYYRRFNFSDRGFCLRTGDTFPSNNHYLDIRSPLSKDNVGKSCNMQATNNFKSHIKTTLRKLEGKRRKKMSNWGILLLMDVAK